MCDTLVVFIGEYSFVSQQHLAHMHMVANLARPDRRQRGTPGAAAPGVLAGQRLRRRHRRPGPAAQATGERGALHTSAGSPAN